MAVSDKFNELENEQSLTHQTREGVIAGGVVGGILVLVLFVLLHVCCLHSKRSKTTKQRKSIEGDHQEGPTVTVDTIAMEETSGADSSPGSTLNVDVPLPIQRRISGYNKKDYDDLQPLKHKMKGDALEATLESYTIDEKRLKLEDVIGRGSFSLVYNGRLYDKSLREYQLVTVKTVHGTGCTPSILKSFVEQGMMLRNFNHPNVLSFLGLVIQDDQPFLALPRMENGDLRSYLVSPHLHFTAKNLIQMGLQVAEGMEYLAGQGFVHRDLATRNCVVDGDGHVKVGDYALSHDMFESDYFLVEQLSPDPLPIGWMAVETLTQLTYSTHSDVWSFGILLWELITRGQAPYSDMDGPTIIAFVRTGQRLEKPPASPTTLYELMQSCWADDPLSRPNFSAICQKLSIILEGPAKAKTADYKKVINASNF